MNTRITPDDPTQLDTDHVYVFSSNKAGRHGKGAALYARKKRGAIYGMPHGMQGNSYAIPAKDCRMNVDRFCRDSLEIEEIAGYVDTFIQFAADHPELIFDVIPIGCNLAGYTPEQMAPLFEKAIHLNNVYLPASFWKVLEGKLSH